MVAQANLDTYPHPDEVGGRFTAAQNNALLPLAMLDGDTALAWEIDAAFAAGPRKTGGFRCSLKREHGEASRA